MRDKAELKRASWSNYQQSWGNYKSDAHKSKRTLKSQISYIMSLGYFTKDELIKIKNLLEKIGFKEFIFKPKG